jgi:diguanylate cyclase (GGDEF)-like protein
MIGAMGSVNTSGVIDAELFRQTPPDAVVGLLADCPTHHLKAGEQLLFPERVNNNLYLVLEGELRVLVGAPGVASPIVIRHGQCVGELSVVDGGRVSAPVVASEDSVVLAIDVGTFWRITERNPAVARNLLAIMAERMRNTNAALVSSLELQQTYERWVYIDPLTGAFNRRWLEQMLPRDLERALRSARPFVLGLCDIDHFKRYNDSHGHAAGDAALRATVHAVQHNARPSDRLARYGGEEFCLLLPNTDLAEAQAMAARLVRAIAGNPIRAADGSPLPSVTISLGLAALGSDANAERMIDAADRALYRAKRDGRNRYAV